MSTLVLRKFTHIATLQRIGCRSLRELLEPYREFFAGRGLVLPPPAAGAEAVGGAGDRPEAELDLKGLAEIFTAPDLDMPSGLVNTLYLLHAMSTPEAMEQLLELAAAARPPLDLTGAESAPEVAVRVFLRQPALLEAVHERFELSRPKLFFTYLTEREQVPELAVPTDAVRLAWEACLDRWFVKKKQGAGSRVLVYPRGRLCWFLIRHGDMLKLEETHAANGETDSVTFRPQLHDVLIYDLDRGQLQIHTKTRGKRELYRKTFGEFLFQDAEYLPGDGKFTLRPFLEHGAAALDCGDMPEIEWAHLRELEFQRPGTGAENRERVVHKAPDLFAVFAARQFVLGPDEVLTRAMIQIKFKGIKQARKVTITPANRVSYLRDEVGKLVETFLRRRGFMLK